MAGRHRRPGGRGAPLAGTPLRVVATLTCLGSTAGVAGLGTYGTFTSTTTADLPQSSGAVALTLGNGGNAGSALTVAATSLVPGDTVTRTVTLTGASSDTAGGLSLSTTATTSSLLTSSTTEGLQLVVEHCAGPWTTASLTCSSGTGRTLVSFRPVLQAGLDLAASAASVGATLASLSNGSDYLKITLTFPSAAGNALQSQTSTIRFSFTLTQRSGTAR